MPIFLYTGDFAFKAEHEVFRRSQALNLRWCLHGVERLGFEKPAGLFVAEDVCAVLRIEFHFKFI